MSVHASDYGSYEDYDYALYEVDADRIEDARREAAEEEFDARAWVCENGHRWDPGEHRATRTDPSYVEMPECPECGGEPVDEPADEPRGHVVHDDTMAHIVQRDWIGTPDEEAF